MKKERSVFEEYQKQRDTRIAERGANRNTTAADQSSYDETGSARNNNRGYLTRTLKGYTINRDERVNLKHINNQPDAQKSQEGETE